MKKHLTLLALFFSSSFALAQPAYNPLDALSADEIAASVRILQKAGKTSPETSYPAITLHEPTKQEVLAWQPGTPFTRQAFVTTLEKGKTTEFILDLTKKEIISTTERPGVEPQILHSEWVKARDSFIADERYKKGIERRGLKLDKVYCTPNSGAYFPSEGYDGKRILRVACFYDIERLHPLIGRPIEGLMGIVDSQSGVVLAVIDNEVVEIQPPPPGYGNNQPVPSDPPMKPVVITRPEGSNVKLSGNGNLNWYRWSLQLRGDKRAGLVVSQVKFRDLADKDRLIAYELNLSEIFVPYMDPNPTWNYRTFLDAGEFGLGTVASSLMPGVDCPQDALFLDVTLPDDHGGSYVSPRLFCVFERATGDPAWRHYSSPNERVFGRAETEMVVRFIPTLGNYDYVVDYVFNPRGSIKVRVGATGYDAIKTSAAADMAAPSAAADTAYGAMVAPYIIAPYHDHYFNFRLDLDVDGPKNTFVRDQFVPELLTDSATRKSIWRLRSKLQTTEGPIVDEHAGGGDEAWRVVNMNTQNGLKQNPSYWLHMNHSATSLLDPNDPPELRAGFAAYDLWVSKYRPDELYAAGAYPNLSHGGDGLPAYTKGHDPIVNDDIVVWYNIGFRHATKPEDFPILPTMWHEFVLRPTFFFDRDPSSLLGWETNWRKDKK